MCIQIDGLPNLDDCTKPGEVCGFATPELFYLTGLQGRMIVPYVVRPPRQRSQLEIEMQTLFHVTLLSTD